MEVEALHGSRRVLYCHCLHSIMANATSFTRVLFIAIGVLGLATGMAPPSDSTLVGDGSSSSERPPIVGTQFNVTDLGMLSGTEGVMARVSNLFTDNGTLSLCAAKAVEVVYVATSKAKAAAVVVGEGMSGASKRIRPVMAEVGARAGELWTKARPVIQYAMVAVEMGCEVMVKEVFPMGRDIALEVGGWANKGIQYVADPARGIVCTGLGAIGKAVVRAASVVAFSGQYWWYSTILPSLLNAQSIADDLMLTVTLLLERSGPPIMGGMADICGRAGDAVSRLLLAVIPRVLDAAASIGATVMAIHSKMPSASSGLDLLIQKGVEAGLWVHSQLPLACSARTLNSVMTSPLDSKWARVLASTNNCTTVGAAIRQWRAAWHPDARLNGRGNNDSRLIDCTVEEIQAGFQSASSTADDIKAVACGDVKTDGGMAGMETRAILKQVAVAIGAPLVGLSVAKLLRCLTR